MMHTQQHPLYTSQYPLYTLYNIVDTLPTAPLYTPYNILYTHPQLVNGEEVEYERGGDMWVERGSTEGQGGNDAEEGRVIKEFAE